MKLKNATQLVLFFLSFTLMISCGDKKEKEPIKATPVKTEVKKPVEAKPIPVKKVIKKQATYKNPYHLVVGSFTERVNAVIAMEKFIALGYEAYLISREDILYTSVSIASFPDIHQAYNEMYNIQDETGLVVWTLFQEKK